MLCGLADDDVALYEITGRGEDAVVGDDGIATKGLLAIIDLVELTIPLGQVRVLHLMDDLLHPCSNVFAVGVDGVQYFHVWSLCDVVCL